MSHIVIYMQMKNKIGNQIFAKGKMIVKNGITLTTYNNSQITQMHIKGLEKDKKEFKLKDNVIAEKHQGKKAHQIADKIEKDLKQLSEQFKKVMDVNISREYVR